MKVKISVFIISILISLFSTACSLRSERIEFGKVCSKENENKIVSVEGYIRAGDSISCSEQRSGGRICGFALSEDLKQSENTTISIFISEGEKDNQVETSTTGEQNRKSFFAKEEIKIRDNNTNLINDNDKVVVSGKTNLVISSSMMPICLMYVEKIEKQ